MVVDRCSLLQSGSDVVSSNASPGDMATSLLPPDVNFNCSSSHIYVPDGEFYADVTTLRRPALFDKVASGVVDISEHREFCADEVADVDSDDAVAVDSELHDSVTTLQQPAVFDEAVSAVVDSHEKICTDEIRYSDGVPSIHDDKCRVSVRTLQRPALFSEAVSEVVNSHEKICVGDVERSDDNVPDTRDADLTPDAVDEVTISAVDIHSSRHDAAVAGDMHLDDRHYAVSADDLFAVSRHDTLAADDEACMSRVHDAESLAVPRDDGDGEGEAVDVSDGADEAAADEKAVSVADVSAADTELLTRDVLVDDECLLSSEQPRVPRLYPTVLLSPAAEQHADRASADSEPQFSEVASENVARHTRSVTSVVSSDGVYLAKRLASEITASVDIVTSVEHECGDLNREAMDAAESELDVMVATEAVSQSDTGRCAGDVETVQQGEAEADESRAVTEKVNSDASDADIERSAASPSSMFFICCRLLLIVLWLHFVFVLCVCVCGIF